MQNMLGISAAEWRKDAGSLLFVFCIIAFIPLSVFLLRPRPLAANTVSELISLAREQTVEESLTELSRHRARWVVQSQESRWEEIAQQVHENDDTLTLPEIRKMLQAAKSAVENRSWPLYAKRAWLDERPVWLVASGDHPGDGNFFCGLTTQKERHDWKVNAAKNLMTIVVIAAEAPHEIVNH